LKPDDLLLLINNVEAGGVQNTVRLMRQVKPGQEVVLRIQRDGKDQDVKVKAMPVPFFLLD
jgi:type II secretory pathway component PulC